MGQILDHIEKQMKKHDRPASNSSDAIELRIKEMQQNGTWPFESVTPENFLNSARPLMKIVYDIHNESGDAYKNRPVELFKDGLHSRVVDMLKCIQALEFETKSRDIVENLAIRRNEQFSPEHDKMYEVLAWAKDELYRYAKHANAYMKDVYSITEATPLDIEEEWEKKIIPEIAISDTRRVQQSHEGAFHHLSQLFDPLLKHGLPAETALGKWYDDRHEDEIRIKGEGVVTKSLTDIKKINESAVKDLIRAQLELDRIEHIVMPKMKLHMVDLQAKAAFEDVAISNAGLSGRSSYWDEYREYDRALKHMEKIIKNMRDREAARLQGATLSITCGKDGTYTLTAERTKGRKKEITMKDGEVTQKKTRNIWGTRLKRVMELGRMTAMLRKEQEDRQAMIYESKTVRSEPTHNPDKKQEEKKTVTERDFGKIGFSKFKQTRYGGQARTAKIQLTGIIARLSKAMTKTHMDGIEKKEEKVWSRGIEIGGNVTGELPTQDKWGTPRFTAEAHISGEAKYKIFGFSAKAGPSAAIGQMWSFEDFQKMVKEDFIRESLKGTDMSAQAIVDGAVKMLRAVGPQKAMDWGTVQLQIGDFTVGKASHKVERDEKTQERHHSVEAKSPLFDDVKNILTSAKDRIAEQQQVREEARQKYQFFEGYAAYAPIVPGAVVRSREIDAAEIGDYNTNHTGPVR